MTQRKVRSQARNCADMDAACFANVFRSLSRSDEEVGARNYLCKEEELTFTEVRDACAVLLNVCIESRDCLALGCNLAPKRSNRRFCLVGLLAFAFEHCNTTEQQQQQRSTKQPKVQEHASRGRDTNRQ
jgi:hypothetical protein